MFFESMDQRTKDPMDDIASLVPQPRSLDKFDCLPVFGAADGGDSLSSAGASDGGPGWGWG